jgi:4-diphosphocytidyl-2-C-methyl-D-erythritol kinase
VFQEIGLSDAVRVHVKIPDSAAAGSGSAGSKPGLKLASNVPISDNLMVRAWDLVRDRLPVSACLEVELEKNIPLGAGLGGGSSDAASFIKYLNRKFKLAMSDAELRELCGHLGSDIPFFVNGGCQTAEGRGGNLKPVRTKLVLDIVLVNPGFGIDTGVSYRNIDVDLFSGGQGLYGPLLEGLETSDKGKVASNLYNIFEVQAFRLYDVLPRIRERLLRAGALNALMSGTGSSVYGVFNTEDEARQCFVSMREEYKYIFLIKSIL